MRGTVKAWLLVGLAGLFVGGAAVADTLVDQGAPGNQGSWFTNPAAQTSGVTAEFLVLNSASGTFPTTALKGRRSIEIQNLGPNAIFCTLGGNAAVVNKSRRIEAVGSSGNSWAADANDLVLLKCIAATADQVTGAASIVTEIK